MYLLDTSVVSEFRKLREGKAHPAVAAWANGISTARLFLSVITVMELQQGILRMERRDAVQGSILRGWLENRVLVNFASRTIDVDTEVALCCAGLHVPNPKSERDAFIAATALVHSLTVVTRNVADFTPTGVPVINPWTP